MRLLSFIFTAFIHPDKQNFTYLALTPTEHETGDSIAAKEVEVNTDTNKGIQTTYLVTSITT
jgi:hypothetical protein